MVAPQFQALFEIGQVVDQGIRMLAGSQGAIGFVGAIEKTFVPTGNIFDFCEMRGGAVAADVEWGVGEMFLAPVEKGGCEFGILIGGMIQGAVEFDVMQARALCCDKMMKWNDLFLQKLDQFVWSGERIAAPTLRGESGMGSDVDVVLPSEIDAAFHRIEISRMSTAGDVGGIDPVHECLGGGGGFVLAEVAVEVGVVHEREK